MTKAMNISYEIGNKLYLNITNKCPCNCTFCIRNNGDGAYGSDPLWLEHQPSAAEVAADLKKRDLDSYEEIIFCGYGEPTNEFEILKETARYIKSVTQTPLRLNTNGLGSLINKRDIAPELEGLIDTVSVSLNASDAQAYDAVTRPSFKGVNCFEEMLRFAKEASKYVPNTMLTVVDVIGEEEIAKSQAVADKVGIKLRVRRYES
ncbi:TIGR04100 family radical SAM protein [Ruminococcus sp. FC2018]|uniref:TIGR04100 family radical SAM protein n=1 Tax=Ruminococcus sp. FC2018 TaxID=1410617 RepID=UPI000A432808|nr:TIGR04100 family radical SAM protein [Ruminococcus sp. FC2018]